MNDFDSSPDELRELFRPHRDAVATHSTEADLSATRSRSVAGQRARVLGGTTAVALLAVGGGALALSAGDTSTPDVVRSASIDEPGPTTDASTPTPVTAVGSPTTAAPSDDGPAGDATRADDDAVRAWLSEFPMLAPFDLDEFPVVDSEDWSGDLTVLQSELESFLDEQSAAIETRLEEVAEWFDARPDGDIVLRFDDFLGDLSMDDLIGHELGELGPGFEADLAEIAEIEITIGDDTVEVDVDGDGVADEVIDLADVEAALAEAADLDLGDLGEIGTLDLDLGDFDLGDIEDLLESGDLDLGAVELPDLSELDLPDGTELPSQEEIDELLSDLETQLDGIDLEQFDLEQFDMEDVDLGELLESSDLNELLDELLGS